MNKEAFETIQELRNDGKKWAEIYFKHSNFNILFPSIQAMKTAFTREQARSRTT